MKALMHKIMFTVLSMSVLLPSCSDKIMTEIDTNPNSPTSVNVRLLLPSTIMSVVYGVAGNFTTRQISFNIEHTANVSVNNVFDPYFINESLWQNGYLALNDTKVLIEYAEKDNLVFYKSIGQVLQVYTLSLLTDVYGDVPFSEALQGNIIRTPKYDAQEAIYTEMFKKLDEAIASLSAPSPDNPGATDLIHGGNRVLWLKTAYALKARLHNRLSKIDPNGSATAALEAISRSFASHTEGWTFRSYQAGTAQDNPWTGFQKAQRVFAIAQSFITHMGKITGNIEDDPRASRWFNRIGGQFVGAPSEGATADPNFIRYSSPSTQNVLADNAQQPLIMYDELMFIKSEAHLRLGQQQEAVNAYRAAVRANMLINNIPEASFGPYLLKLESQPFSLNALMDQKYISFFMFNPIEAFNDWRRTGIPQLTSQRMQVLRLPYPNTEANRNPNTPTSINEATIYTIPVWWDK